LIQQDQINENQVPLQAGFDFNADQNSLYWQWAEPIKDSQGGGFLVR